MKSKTWWVFLPGEVYANSWHFEDAVTEREARAWVRECLELKRLPRGTQAWAG